MRCNKCGKDIRVNQYHDCSKQQPKRREKIIITEPERKADNFSFTQERQAVIITPGFNLATIDELKTLKRQGNGLKVEVMRIISSIGDTLKNPTIRNITVMVAAALSMLVWLVTIYNPHFSYMPATGLKGILAIVFGSYNNVMARTLHFSSVFSLLSVFIPQFLKHKSISIGGISQAYKNIRMIIKNSRSKKFGLLIMSIGFAYVFGNIMMRNNAINKYLACATFGITLLLATKELRATPFVRLLLGFMNDLKRHLRMSAFMAAYSDTLREGFGLGLIATILLSLLHKVIPYTIGENLGYIIGSLMTVVGFILQIRARTEAQSVSGE